MQARGLALSLNWLTLGKLEYLAEIGEIEKALEGASGYVERLQGGDDVVNLVSARALLARLLALQGRPEQMVDSLDWLESSARGLEEPQWIVLGLGASALTRASLGENDAAGALLDEIEAYPDAREDIGQRLPLLVRTALEVGHVDLAERLTTGVEPRWPYTEHALIAASAALDEAHGNHHSAADGLCQNYQQREDG